MRDLRDLESVSPCSIAKSTILHLQQIIYLLTITAGYETGEEFASRYGTWFSSIRAKRLTATVIE